MNDRATEIANFLEEFALFLELDGQSGRASAYERAARSIKSRRFIPADPSNIDGVGEGIRTKIAQWQRKGEIPELEELRERYDWFDELKDVKHIGPARAKTLHNKFSIDTIDDLLLVGDDITLMDGVGQVTATKILESAREQQT